MSQITFTTLAEKLAASGIREQANIQGHTLTLGNDITVDFAELTAKNEQAPAGKATERARITHARDNMQDNAKTMIAALVKLGARDGDRNTTVKTLLGNIWESAIHQERLRQIYQLSPNAVLTQDVVTSSATGRTDGFSRRVHASDLQQEQLGLLLYRLSDQDLVALSKASSGELMDALNESLGELVKTSAPEMAQNIDAIRNDFQKLRLAVMTETSTRLDLYGRKPESAQQYQALHNALASVDAENKERLNRADDFIQRQEHSQVCEEWQSLAPQLKTSLASPELELNERQQRTFLDAAHNLYLRDRKSLHAQARQELMDIMSPNITDEAVLGKAQQLFCARLCASTGKPSDCEKQTGFRAALLSNAAAQHERHSEGKLRPFGKLASAERPFADLLWSVGMHGSERLQTEFCSEIDKLRTLLQGGTENTAVFNELYGGFHPHDESELAEAALIRAATSLLRQSWLAIKDMCETPMHPNVWARLLSCTDNALHGQNCNSADVARLMPLALEKANRVAAQLHELTQKSGSEPLTGLKDVVARCIDDIPTRNAQEKGIVASSVMELAEVILSLKPVEVALAQSPNQILAELASEVKESTAPMDAAVREFNEAEAVVKVAKENLQSLKGALDAHDFSLKQAAELDEVRAKAAFKPVDLTQQIGIAQQQEEQIAEKKTELADQVRDIKTQVRGEADRTQWTALREKLNEPDSKYTMKWMLDINERSQQRLKALTTEELGIYRTMTAIYSVPPTREEMDAAHIDKEVQHQILIVIKDQLNATRTHADAVNEMGELKDNPAATEEQIQNLMQEKSVVLLRKQFLGHQLKMAHNDARRKLSSAMLTLAQKKDSMFAQQNMVYTKVWQNPANTNKLIPGEETLKNLYFHAQNRQKSIETVLSPFYTQELQARNTAEAARRSIEISQATHAQNVKKNQTEMTSLKLDQANLRQRGDELQAQQEPLTSALDDLRGIAQRNEVEKQKQIEHLQAESTTIQTQKQKELASLNTQVDNLRQNLTSMQNALENGTRSVAGCRQWIKEEIRLATAQEEQVRKKFDEANNFLEKAVATRDAEHQILLKRCHLPEDAEPILSAQVMADTLKGLPAAQRPAVNKAMQNYNSNLNDWLRVRAEERNLDTLITNEAHELAKDHVQGARLRTEQLHLLMAQDAKQPWQGEGPRPTNIAERLREVGLALEECANAILARTVTMTAFHDKLTKFEDDAGIMLAAMKEAATSLPAKTLARELAEAGSKFVGARHEGGKQHHSALFARVEIMQHLQQCAYPNAVRRSLETAESNGVQDAFLRILAASENAGTLQRIDEAQKQLQRLDKQRQDLTADIARQAAFIAEYQTILADPHHGVDQRALTMAEQAVQEHAQALEDNAAALRSNEAAQASLTEQLLNMTADHQQATAQQVEDLEKATTSHFEAQRELIKHEAEVQPEMDAWQKIIRAEYNHFNLPVHDKPVTNGQRLETKLNAPECLRMAQQEELPLNHRNKIELSRLSTALLNKSHPLPPESRTPPLRLLHDGPTIPKELLQKNMLQPLMAETIADMPRVVNAMLDHDMTLLPWKDLFERMNADASGGAEHRLIGPFNSEIDAIVSDASSMSPEQWKLTYGDGCSLETLVRLACRRCMRGVINDVQTLAARQGDDLSLLFRGYSLAAIRDLRTQAENAPLAERQRYSSVEDHLRALTPPTAQIPPETRETARQEIEMLTPFFCQYYAHLVSDPYQFRSTTNPIHNPPQTDFELEGILRFNLASQRTINSLGLPEEAWGDRSDHTDAPMNAAAKLVEAYHSRSREYAKLLEPLRPDFEGKLRPLLLDIPAITLARYEKSAATQAANTLNSPHFLNFVGHVKHLWEEENAHRARQPNTDMEQLNLLVTRLDELLHTRNILNKELGMETKPIPQFTYQLENTPQSVRNALSNITLRANDDRMPAPFSLTAAQRSPTPRPDKPVAKEDRVRFLELCRTELTTQQRERNLRATLYGDILCSMLRATGSEVDENIVFQALAGYGLSREKQNTLLNTIYGQPLEPMYRTFLEKLMFGGSIDAAHPSLEEEVVVAARKLEDGSITTRDFARFANMEAEATKSIIHDLQLENVLLQTISNPCPAMATQFNALYGEELRACAKHTKAVAHEVEDFSAFRAYVAGKLPLPSSDIPEFNEKYTKLYHDVQTQLDEYAKHLENNAGHANYMDGLLRANVHQLPLLNKHIGALHGELGIR